MGLKLSQTRMKAQKSVKSLGNFNVFQKFPVGIQAFKIPDGFKDAEIDSDILLQRDRWCSKLRAGSPIPVV